MRCSKKLQAICAMIKRNQKNIGQTIDRRETEDYTFECKNWFVFMYEIVTIMMLRRGLVRTRRLEEREE